MTEQEYEAFKNFIHELLYERMTLDDYEIIMRRLGANKRGDRYTTICHNEFGGGYNLAFIPSTRIFYCHSECCCSYSLLSLIKQRRELLGLPCSTYQSLKWLCNELGVEFNFKEEVKQVNTNIYKWQNTLLKYTKNKNKNIELRVYNKKILNYFPKIYHTDWIDYGISEEVLDKYNIGWYNYKQQITIPCYRQNGDLIGIRVRNMNPEIDIKYIPLQLLDGTEFNFPTNEVFYGENFNWTNIQRTKSVILVESEKTVMKYESWYGAKNNICLGLYGSVLSNTKLKKLLSWNCETFYICLDSDFESIEYSNNDEKITSYEKFEKKVMNIYNKLKPYAKSVYVIYNNLGFENCYKYSITDYTREQFEKIWNNKEKIEI